MVLAEKTKSPYKLQHLALATWKNSKHFDKKLCQELWEVCPWDEFIFEVQPSFWIKRNKIYYFSNLKEVIDMEKEEEKHCVWLSKKKEPEYVKIKLKVKPFTYDD